MSKALTPQDVVKANLCIGCGGCASTMRFDRNDELKPDIVSPSPCATIEKICPFSPSARNEDEIAAERFPNAAHTDPLIGRYEAAYVGHVAESDFRLSGSSGGMVSWVAAELLRRGLVDGIAHVAPADPANGGRFFEYRLSRDVQSLQAGAKSRYYPVDLSAVLREIREVPGRYAVIGVPCFIKAMHLHRAADPVLEERIAFTLGLFCGHMKSARLVESFAWQLDAPFEQVRAVEYRRKDPERPANWYTAQLTLTDGSRRWQDWWHLADGDWGAGYFQNNACNYCDDVVSETADIAFGDAWVEPYSSDGRGTNVVIVRSPLVHGLVTDAIGEGRLSLKAVDNDFIIQTQAAGFRHRREGLAYRLKFMPPRLPLRKRVTPGADLRWRRKLVYRARAAISRNSHRMAALSHRLQMRGLYVDWARGSLRLYEAITYLRWPLGRLLAKFERNPDA